MAVLSRRSFNTIEILRVDSDPNGTSAITGSLAKVVGSSVVWKNVGGTSWEVLNSGALAPLSGPAGSPVGASYVVLGGDGTLTSERVLTAGSGISITDGGAGGNLTIAATGGGGGGSGKLLGSSYVESGAFGGEYGAAITTVCPIDDTIPQLSEGQVILTTPSYTTQSATSKLRITAHVNATTANANYTVVAHIHRDNTADAENVARQATSGNSYPQNIDMVHQVSSPGAGVSLTYKVVVGTQTGTNAQVNGYAGVRWFGGKLLSTLLIEEIES